MPIRRIVNSSKLVFLPFICNVVVDTGNESLNARLMKFLRDYIKSEAASVTRLGYFWNA